MLGAPQPHSHHRAVIPWGLGRAVLLGFLFPGERKELVGDWEMGNQEMGDRHGQQCPGHQQQDGAHKRFETPPDCSVAGEPVQGRC